MWGLSFSIYVVLKVLSLNMRTRSGPAWKHVAYLVAWPGMDVDSFLTGRPTARPAASEWLFAVAKLSLGVVLIRVVVPSVIQFREIAGWIGMIGIVFVLHFGVFHLLSCLWRSVGVAAVPIMNWPIVSQSMTEFWGRRWNLAFRDLTHRLVFLPLIHRLGPLRALLLGFVISGVIHDLVISWPASGGWGLPTCYFLLQGAGITFERTGIGKSLGLGRGLIGRLYCWLLIALPSPLLLHHPFIDRVILPFLAVIGATGS